LPIVSALMPVLSDRKNTGTACSATMSAILPATAALTSAAQPLWHPRRLVLWLPEARW
jgi:hypothetical protein